MTAKTRVWTNPDGLRVNFGVEQAKGALVGSPCVYGAINQLTAIFEASDLVLAGGQLDADANHVIPAGSMIVRASLLITEAFTSGGAATLEIGFSNADGTYTNLDEDGIVTAAGVGAVANLTLGRVAAGDGVLASGTGNRILQANGYLSYDVDTALFTAGKAKLIVEYFAPTYPDQGVT